MTLTVNNSTAYIQEQVILTEAHSVEHAGGELRWRRREPDWKGEKIDVEDRRVRDAAVREEEIVFICRESEPRQESEQGRKPHGLESESAPSPFTNGISSGNHDTTRFSIYFVRENLNKDHEADEPFSLAALSTPTLPRELLNRYLLDELPAHLQGGADIIDNNAHTPTSSPSRSAQAPEVHVILSTKSGLGLARAVYGSVLQKLLAVVGLRPFDDLTPPDSPGPSNGRSHSLLHSHYNLFVTTSRDSIRNLARTRWSTGKGQGRVNQLIILMSGDGGVVDLLNGADDEELPPGAADQRQEQQQQQQPTIAILPLGTGNALFHSLHRPIYKQQQGPAPSPLVLGLRTLFKGVPAPLPTFRASFSPGSMLVPHYNDSDDDSTAHAVEEPKSSNCTTTGSGRPVDHLLGAIVASYGFHAQLVWESDTPEYRRHGAKRFGMAAGELLKIGHAYDAVVEVAHWGRRRRTPPRSANDGGEEGGFVRLRHPARRRHSGDASDDDERLTYILATMVSNLEKDFTISPASQPLDGVLRLVSFGAVGAEKTMEIMQRAYGDGAHVDMVWPPPCDGGEEGEKVVGYQVADEIRVVIREAEPRWRKVCIDGTIVELPKDGWMTVRKMEGSRFRVLADPSVF